MLEKNMIYEMQADDLTIEGMGIGRIEGIAVFTADMLPGESARVRIIKTAKNYAVGRVEERTFTSPERRDPPCPVFTRCGGCSLQHLSYPAQLNFKWRHIQNCLKKIGGSDAEVNFPMPVREALRYRNKTALPVAAGKDGQTAIGCFAKRTHDVIDCRDCLLQSEDAARCVEAVRCWMHKYDIEPYDEATGKGVVRHIMVRETSFGDMMLIVVAATDELPHARELIREVRIELPQVISIYHNVNAEKGNVILGKKDILLFGAEYLTEELSSMAFRISPHSFLQVNHYGTEILYSTLMKVARLLPKDIVADLYCGAGTISLTAAKHCAQVFGIEIEPQAVSDAKINAQINGVQNAEFLCADCAEGFGIMREKGFTPNVVIVDPPRKGLAESVIGDICNAAPDRVVYVSCDPATLARDVVKFAERGYKAVIAQPVDMFPQTTHVECVVLMSRIKD